MPIEFNDGDGIQALDQNEHSDRWQYSVKSGVDVSPGTNDLTVQCSSGGVIFDGTSVSVGAQDNVSLAAADDTQPRKDVVYVDANGSLKVATGTPEAAVPSGETRFQTQRPAPNDLSGTDAVVVAEVWVAAGVSDIAAADVRDRRQFADLATRSLDTEQGQSNRWETRTDDLVNYTDDGAWTWFNGPRAVQANGKTFTGWVDSNGDIVAASYDHSTGSVTTNTIKASLGADDHNAPGILVQGDGTVTFTYAAHPGSDAYVRNSSSSYDISTFDSEVTISPSTQHTYMVPHELGGTIYLFYRNDAGSLAYVTSTDGGSTWSGESELVTQSGHAAYFQIDSDGSRIDIALTHSVEYQDGPKQDVRHVYFDGSSLYSTSGSLLSAPIDIDTATPIYDSAATGNHDTWVWDCVQHASDNIEVTFAEFVTPEKHVYRYAHWDGSAWSHHRICDGGSYIGTGAQSERYYSGGVVLDNKTPGRLFVSVSDADTSAIQEWRTEDNGSSWRYTDYAAGTGQAVRPVVPRNRRDDLEVLYMEGNYQYYKGGGYETSIRGGKSGTTPQSQSYTPGVLRAWTSNGIDIPSGSFTQIELNESVFDARSELDTSANKVVIEETGVYLVEASVGYFAVDAAGEYFAEVQVNGSGAIQTNRSNAQSGDYPSSSGSSVFFLNKGDTITLKAFQDSGNAQTIITERKTTRLHLYQLR